MSYLNLSADEILEDPNAVEMFLASVAHETEKDINGMLEDNGIVLEEMPELNEQFLLFVDKKFKTQKILSRLIGTPYSFIFDPFKDIFKEKYLDLEETNTKLNEEIIILKENANYSKVVH